VKTILEYCDKENKYYSYGLKICGFILKPYEYLPVIEELEGREDTVDAFLVEEGQIFYSLSSRFQS
jgi:hypothetical protein